MKYPITYYSCDIRIEIVYVVVNKYHNTYITNAKGINLMHLELVYVMQEWLNHFFHYRIE